ncbi:MAG: CBS domain-containing protein [Actinomycetota bacterium]|jgi:CBS domain-containing protein/sporulation protein YlmC with PRC-barrel domain|nr:CBS domain-containing protein [Actinomycetota bacterium]
MTRRLEPVHRSPTTDDVFAAPLARPARLRHPPGEPEAGGGAPRRTRRRNRTRRILATREVRDAIVSLAGLVGRPVYNQAGAEIGRLADVVCRWSDGQTYPPVTGLVVRIGRRLAFVDASVVGSVAHDRVTLQTARLDLRDFAPRAGEVTLAAQVLDHQLVDVDGVQVIRAADLYLAPVLGRIRLVGVDISVQTLLRRLGPARWRPTPTPERVIDWAAIEPFGDTEPGGAPQVRLRTTNAGLQRLRPGELADLLEDLQRPERQRLLDALPPGEAADALEEMDPEELAALLREEAPARAAVLIGAMEPDEAVDALRGLTEAERSDLFARMPDAKVRDLRRLLDYPEDEAGGFMTTALVIASVDETVGSVVRRLATDTACPDELDAVAVVGGDGRLVWDLPLRQLVVSDPETHLAELVGEAEPVTVGVEAGVPEVADRLVDARRLSVVVVDEEGRPVGRILADDVLDAMIPGRSRLHFPRLLQ